MMNSEQFTRLVRRYIDTVFRVALNYLRNPSDAEDITQTVFEKLLREEKPFESEEHIRNWLIRVTVNECKKLLRSPWRFVEPIEDYMKGMTFENTAQSELYRAVMGLPKKYRLAIYLHYYEGYSTQEIGRILRIPKNTVCSHLKRGRELLKKELQEADDNV